MLIPATARPWISAESRRRPWSNHGAMMIRRREALDALRAAYSSWLRLGLGVLAWVLAGGGAVLVGRGIAADGEGLAGPVGTALLVVAAVLGGLLVATGARLTRAIAQWWSLATRVGADGGRVDATSGLDTQRAHQAAVAADRSSGAGALWRWPLLLHTLAAVLLLVLAVVLLVQVGLGAAEATTPYAAGEVRGPWVARIFVAVFSLLAAVFIVRGLRRIHRARLHRDAPASDDDAPARPAVATPALGTGAIVVGGRGAVAGPPPAWASPTSAASSDGAPPAGPAPAHPAPPVAAPAAAPRAVAPTPASALPAVRLSDGRRLALGVTLVGRAPQPRPGEEVDATLAVADERVSKTHLTVTVGTHGGVVVVDRGSTNGTVLHSPDGAERKLVPGEPQELGEGDAVLLGATTLTVGEVSQDVEHTVLRPAP